MLRILRLGRRPNIDIPTFCPVAELKVDFDLLKLYGPFKTDSRLKPFTSHLIVQCSSSPTVLLMFAHPASDWLDTPGQQCVWKHWKTSRAVGLEYTNLQKPHSLKLCFNVRHSRSHLLFDILSNRL